MLPKRVWCGVVFALSLALPGRSEILSDHFQSDLLRAEVKAHITRLEEEVSELRLALLTRAPAFQEFARRSLFAPEAAEGKEAESTGFQLGLHLRRYNPALYTEPHPPAPKLRLNGSLFAEPAAASPRQNFSLEFAASSAVPQP